MPSLLEAIQEAAPVQDFVPAPVKRVCTWCHKAIAVGDPMYTVEHWVLCCKRCVQRFKKKRRK
jgi:hypothetical protein